MSKRKAAEIDANVEDTREIKKKCVGIENLVFLFFTAASCGLCQGCDLCHPEECEPEEANAIRKDGMIYKQIGRGFDLSLCQFNLPVYSDACRVLNGIGLQQQDLTTTVG